MKRVCFFLFLFSVANSNEFDEEITASIDKATNIVVDEQQAKNLKLGLLGLALSGLIIFAKSLAIPFIIGILNTLPFLKDGIAGALKGALKGLRSGNLVKIVTGTLGGLANSFTTKFKEIAEEIGVAFLKGVRNMNEMAFENELILKNFKFRFRFRSRTK